MKLKYYLRGIGVGILFSTILLSVAFRVSSKSEFSDDEIIKRAEALGMVMKDDNNLKLDDLLEPTSTPEITPPETQVSSTPETSDTDVEPTTTPIVEVTAAPTSEPTNNPDESNNTSTDNTTVEPTSEPTNTTVEPTSVPTKNEEDNSDIKVITVEILNGMSSENVSSLLKNSGVINDDKEFNKYMREHGFTTKIKVGEYKIPVDSTFEQIANFIVDKQ
ncbi:MAG: hypothetical protein K0S41_3232 [Anaerocolumna sp.]|nr:hypothetical protein [Anaerocolumna sp.]